LKCWTNFHFSNNNQCAKSTDFVLHLSLYAAGIFIYNSVTIAGDRATPASDLSTAMVPYGTGGILVMPPACNMPLASMR
jgi:hypothetical protein